MAYSMISVRGLSLFLFIFYTTVAATVNDPDTAYAQPSKLSLFGRASSEKGKEKANPIDMEINIAKWPDISEQDCFVALCLEKGERTYQKVENPKQASDQRTASGAGMVPFRADQLEIRHTKQITSETISAEEFPWADSHEGGDHAYLLPATRSQQSSQGGSVSSAFQKFRVEKNQWFRINMKGKLGKYCTALHKDPPDMSVCDPEEETELYGVIVHMTDNVYHIDKDHGTPYTLDRVFGPRKGTVKKGKRDITLEKDSTNTDNISLA